MVLTELTLPDSGATVRVKRISPMSLMAIEQAYPDPKPPLQEVDYGNGKLRHERNPLDPAYQEELTAHQRKKSLIVLKAFIRLGVECEIDAQALSAFRADMQALEITLDPDDKYVYVAHILCQSNNDLMALRTFIEGQSVPTEKAVAEKLATFQGDLQEPGPVRLEAAA
jgi:hypothetical protein